LTSLSLRYAEALFQKPRLSRKLAEVSTYKNKLPKVDKELSFLQFLKTNQPAYLDAISIIAGSAAPGTRVDSLSINRRGDLSLRGTMQNSQQITDFRSKLIDSGFFATVAVEEQTPSPDRQRVVVRISAQCKPSAEAKIETARSAETGSASLAGEAAARNSQNPRQEIGKSAANN
jgi:hypothetical protein